MKRIVGMLVFLSLYLGMSARNQNFQHIVELSHKGHWAILGNWWLVNDGTLQKQFLPKQPEFFHSPMAFFDGRKKLIYTRPGGRKAVFLAAYDIGNRSSEDLVTLPEEAFAIAPSPDNRQVALVGGYNVLRVVDIQTQRIRDIAPAWSTSIPSWSPDGKYIVFEKNKERDQGWGDSEIAIASLDSGKVLVLDKGRSPSWSPKGDLIAYTDVDGKKLKLIDPRGAHGRILKKNWAAVMGPIEGPLIWSPDQTKLIFHRTHDDLHGEGHSKAYLLDIVTGDMKHLASDVVVLGWQ